jgi:heme-degrading monooxygenase HmoA
VSVVEVTTFRLRAGVPDDAFLALDKRLQTELVPNQPGFLRRTTARRGGAWVVVTLWGSEADAATFESATAGHELWRAFGDHIEPDSLRSTRYDTLD